MSFALSSNGRQPLPSSYRSPTSVGAGLLFRALSDVHSGPGSVAGSAPGSPSVMGSSAAPTPLSPRSVRHLADSALQVYAGPSTVRKLINCKGVEDYFQNMLLNRRGFK